MLYCETLTLKTSPSRIDWIIVENETILYNVYLQDESLQIYCVDYGYHVTDTELRRWIIERLLTEVPCRKSKL